MPAVFKDVEEQMPSFVNMKSVVNLRITEPPANLGLLQCRWKKGVALAEVNVVRKTPLFDKFMKVQF